MGGDFSFFFIFILILIVILLHVRDCVIFHVYFDFDFRFLIFYFDFTFIARTDSVVLLQLYFDGQYLFIFIFNLFVVRRRGLGSALFLMARRRRAFDSDFLMLGFSMHFWWRASSGDPGSTSFDLGASFSFAGTRERPVRTVRTSKGEEKKGGLFG